MSSEAPTNAPLSLAPEARPSGGRVVDVAMPPLPPGEVVGVQDAVALGS